MRKFVLVLSVVLFCCAASVADAGPLGRCLGLGWNDGYHAKCCCDHGHGGFLRGLFCSDPCWHDHHCVKTKAISPGAFGCVDDTIPTPMPCPTCN